MSPLEDIFKNCFFERRGTIGVTGATGIVGGTKGVLVETGYIDFNTGLIHTNKSESASNNNRTKCVYCGQYSNRYNSCNHCGAPVD